MAKTIETKPTTYGVVDTAPPAPVDYRLEYFGFHGCRSACRIRVYPMAGGGSVILATELPENEGTSITNVAEIVHAAAWENAGQPVPVRFVEHYPGDEVPESPADAERFDQVLFPTHLLEEYQGQPLQCRAWRHSGLTGEPVPADGWVFHTPTWKHLPKATFLGWLGLEEDNA